MTEKVHREKLQGMQTCLTYGESSHRNSRTREETQLSKSESCDRRRRHKKRKPSPATMPRDTHPLQNTSVFSRLRREGPEVAPRRRYASERRSAGSNTSAKDPNRIKKHTRSLIQSYVTCFSERQREIEKNGMPLIERAAGNLPGQKKLISPKMRTTRVDTGNPGLRNIVPKKTHMSANVKTYDGTRDPEDQLNFFLAASKIERWAMPTWCHMFNFTLIGSARVWFDKLPPKFIDNYKILRNAFLGNFSQQKKYIKDPVEIHHIKQGEGESTEAFMERFKAESMDVNEAPECMRIFGIMHGITNPDLIKKMNDNIPKFVDEIMNVTTTFLKGEVTAANQSRKKVQPMWRHHETNVTPPNGAWTKYVSEGVTS
nr:reverse transcriptase domain-containing protein [Tanacetum cinerariifolium]